MSTANITDVTKAAQHYRDTYNFNVIPLKQRSKTPAVGWKEFQNRRVSDQEFENFDFKNVGIVTGKTSRLVVVDVDNTKRFHEWVEKSGFELPTTASVKTARGYHLYFRIPEGLEVQSKTIVDGALEVKGDGSQVVAPPSIVEKLEEAEKGIKSNVRHQYDWIHSPDEVGIAECPDWLLEVNEEWSEGRAAPVEATIEEGSRNTTLFSRARSLFKQGYNETEVIGALYAVNQNRCKPPIDDDELRDTVESASKYDRGNFYASHQRKTKDENTFGASKLGDIMQQPIEPPELYIDQLLYKNSITSLYAPGGSGKTIFALWIATLVIQQGLTVIYVDEEMGVTKLGERLQQMGVDPELVKKYLYHIDQQGPTLDNIEKWTNTLEAQNPDLVIFDPLADLLSISNLDENIAGDVTKWIKAFVQPVKEMGGSALILDHVMKDDSGKYARGSSAKHAKVDAAWKLKVKGEFDRDTVGKIEIHRDKDRLGSLPELREFDIGGRDGELIVVPGEIKEHVGPRTDGLRPAEFKVLSILKKNPGMDRAFWKKECVKENIPDGTFRPALQTLKVKHVWKDDNGHWWLKKEDVTSEDNTVIQEEFQG